MNTRTSETGGLMKMIRGKIQMPAAIVPAVMIWILTAAIQGGCGKKAPPEPPSENRPPKVIDLDYSISNNTVKLSWTIPKTNERAQSPATGFLIYRSKQTAIEADCPNCPIRFRAIGDVPVRGTAPDQIEMPAVVFAQTIEPGYRYIYKVRAYDEDGIAGKDSNVVDFNL
jgi:hypothetical protein